jgi:hypothetical protein
MTQLTLRLASTHDHWFDEPASEHALVAARLGCCSASGVADVLEIVGLTHHRFRKRLLYARPHSKASTTNWTFRRPEPTRDLTMAELLPPLCLSEPLPTVFRVRFRALNTPQFHGAAVYNFIHGVADILGRKEWLERSGQSRFIHGRARVRHRQKDPRPEAIFSLVSRTANVPRSASHRALV